jgi:hypothetical protein
MLVVSVGCCINISEPKDYFEESAKFGYGRYLLAGRAGSGIRTARDSRVDSALRGPVQANSVACVRRHASGAPESSIRIRWREKANLGSGRACEIDVEFRLIFQRLFALSVPALRLSQQNKTELNSAHATVDSAK